MKRAISSILIGILLFTPLSTLTAYADQCSAINSQTSYETCCTGQSADDSVACQNYATSYIKQVDPSNPQCANITDDNMYNQCCDNNDATDSPICVAYNNS